MVDETKPDTNLETPAPVINKKVIGATGNEIELQPSDMAIMIVLDAQTGNPAIYNIQGVPRAAFARMLLHEGLDLYRLNSTCSGTANLVQDALMKAMDSKKRGLILPFQGK